MTFKLAAISDIHYGTPGKNPRRKCEYGPLLLRRAVENINLMAQPDVVVVLGDCLNDPKAPDALEKLTELKDILSLLQCPVVVIPGNHDPQPDLFYQVMDAPPDVIDIAGVRLLPFIDPERPGYNAERLPENLTRMKAARNGHLGPIIALQHVPVLPPGQTACHYGYTNIAEIMGIMVDQAITLSISGHEHKGTPTVHCDGSAFVTVQALCEEPFTYTMVTVSDTTVEVEPIPLQMPPSLKLIDTHIHTQFAYCGRGLDMAASVQIARLLGLAGVVFAEHSGQLYFDKPLYWQEAFCEEGVQDPRLNPARMKAYWENAGRFLNTIGLGAQNDLEAEQEVAVWAGLEIDCDYHGRPVVLEADIRKAQLLNGAVHYLPASRQKPVDTDRLADQFLAATASFLRSGIHVLAHPFRIFRRSKTQPPAHLYEPLVKMLKEAGIAAEINFHTNTPEPDFFRLCLAAGVPLSLGSDAHELWAIGDFAPHLQFLRKCGYDGNLTDILISPPGLPL